MSRNICNLWIEAEARSEGSMSREKIKNIAQR